MIGDNVMCITRELVNKWGERPRCSWKIDCYIFSPLCILFYFYFIN